MDDCNAQLCSLCPCCFTMCVFVCQGRCWYCDWRAVMEDWWQWTFCVWALRRECQSTWIRLLNGSWNFCTTSWPRCYSSKTSSHWCRSATSLQSTSVHWGLYNYICFDMKPHIGTKSYIAKQNIKHVADLRVWSAYEHQLGLWQVLVSAGGFVLPKVCLYNIWYYHVTRIIYPFLHELRTAWLHHLIMCNTSMRINTQHTLIRISTYPAAYLASFWGLKSAGRSAELYLLPLACESCINRKHGRSHNSIPKSCTASVSISITIQCISWCIVFIHSFIRFHGHWGHSRPFDKSTDTTNKFIYGSRVLTAHAVGRSS